MFKSKLHIALFSLLFLSIAPNCKSQISTFQEAFEQKQIDRDKREAELAKKRADSERRANENKKATPF